jgi:hypothetical protein
MGYIDYLLLTYFDKLIGLGVNNLTLVSHGVSAFYVPP